MVRSPGGLRGGGGAAAHRLRRLPTLRHRLPAWHSAATFSRRSSFVPYLLVPYGGAVPSARSLYSLQNDKVVDRVVLPKVSQHWRCVVSCEGWLFVADLDANIFLYNPLSGSRVDLPSQAAVCKGREVIIPETTWKGKEKEEGMIFLQKGWRLFELSDFYFWKGLVLAIEITTSNYKIMEYFALPLNPSLGGQKYLAFVPSGRLYLISRFADLRPRERKDLLT